MNAGAIATNVVQLSTCIGCGCTDEQACKGGCHWERVDRAAALGVCSSCPEHIARWDDGDRKRSKRARVRAYNRGYYSRNKKDWAQKYPRSPRKIGAGGA